MPTREKMASARVVKVTGSERRLLDEYHALVDLELDGSLSPAQATRLREVEQALGDADRQDPETRATFAHLEKTAAKLDQLLQAVRELPKAPVGG